MSKLLDVSDPVAQPGPGTTKRVSKISLDDPRVIAIMAGVERTGARGYRKDGRHYGLRKQLVAVLGIAIATADKLIKRAVQAGLLPLAEEPVKPPKVPRQKEERKKPKLAAIDDADEEPEEEHVSPYHERQQQQARARFQLCKSVSRHGTFYGVFDVARGTEELISPDRREALQEIERRVQAEDMDHVPYYLKFRTG